MKGLKQLIEKWSSVLDSSPSPFATILESKPMAKPNPLGIKSFSQHLNEMHTDDLETLEGDLEDAHSEHRNIKAAIDWHEKEKEKLAGNPIDLLDSPHHPFNNQDMPFESEPESGKSYGGMPEHQYRTMQHHMEDASKSLAAAHMAFHNAMLSKHHHHLAVSEDRINYLKSKIDSFKPQQ